MRHTFADLEKLQETDPTSYSKEVSRLRVQDPERLDRFIEWLRRNVSHAPDARPLSAKEVGELTDGIARALGWPKERVLAEAILRLHETLHAEDEPFSARTPDARPAIRRRASIEALVLAKPKARRA